MATNAQHHQNDLARLKRLRLMDDDFLSICMKDNIAGVQLMLRIILDNEHIYVKSVHTQDEYKSLSGHSFCFDVYAEDAEGKKLEIEVQRQSAGARAERAACHSGVLDANSMPRNDEDFSHKAETYVIFITEHDVLKGNLPIYHVERCILEMDKQLFGGKSHIVYVNGAYKGHAETSLGKLMHDMLCDEPDKMHYQELAERARYFKEDSEGVKAMCEIWEEVRREGEAKGEARGALKTWCSSVKALMTKQNMTLTEAMALLSIPEDKKAAIAELL